jgi:hypothetical protein
MLMKRPVSRAPSVEEASNHLNWICSCRWGHYYCRRNIFFYPQRLDRFRGPCNFLSSGYLGLKRPESETDHSLSYSAEVKNVGAIPPLTHMSSWRDEYWAHRQRSLWRYSGNVRKNNMTEGLNIQCCADCRSQGSITELCSVLKASSKKALLFCEFKWKVLRDIFQRTRPTYIFVTCGTAVTSQYPHLVRGLLRGTLLALPGGAEEPTQDSCIWTPDAQSMKQGCYVRDRHSSTSSSARNLCSSWFLLILLSRQATTASFHILSNLQFTAIGHFSLYIQCSGGARVK